MGKFWKKQRGSLVVIMYLVGLGCIIFFTGGRLLESIEDKRLEVVHKKADQEIRREQLQKLPQLQSQLEEVTQNRESLDFLIKRDKALDLIKNLEEVAQQTGNKIEINIPVKSSLSQRNTSNEDEDEEFFLDKLAENEYIEMDIKLKGSFQSFYNFIYKIENLKYFSNVSSFAVERFEDNDNTQDILGRNLTEDKDSQVDQEVQDPLGSINNSVESTIKTIFYLEN